MIQVQVRIPEELLEKIDEWIKEGKYNSRSEAIRYVLMLYEEKEKTREFYKMLVERSREAKEKTEDLIPLDEI
jgi:Ribbon-helix-helix protein, copG family.